MDILKIYQYAMLMELEANVSLSRTRNRGGKRWQVAAPSGGGWTTQVTVVP